MREDFRAAGLHDNVPSLTFPPPDDEYQSSTGATTNIAVAPGLLEDILPGARSGR